MSVLHESARVSYARNIHTRELVSTPTTTMYQCVQYSCVCCGTHTARACTGAQKVVPIVGRRGGVERELVPAAAVAVEGEVGVEGGGGEGAEGGVGGGEDAGGAQRVRERVIQRRRVGH